MVADDGWAMRTVMRDEGTYPPRSPRSAAVSAVAADGGVGGTGPGRASVRSANKTLTPAIRLERMPTGLRTVGDTLQLGVPERPSLEGSHTR